MLLAVGTLIRISSRTGAVIGDDTLVVPGEVTRQGLFGILDDEIGRAFGDIRKGELGRTGGGVEQIGVVLLHLHADQGQVRQRIGALDRIFRLGIAVDGRSGRKEEIQIAVILAAEIHAARAGRGVEGHIV